MKRSGTQYKLFETDAQFSNGLIYRPNFITPEEEELLIIFIEEQSLRHARGGKEGEYEAKRRHASFGWGFDYENNTLIPGPPLPLLLQRFARRIEKWLDLSRGRVVEALINEYTPGTTLGWHRDNERCEHVVGISLAGWTRMRFRPLAGKRDPKKVLSLELEPRSVYVMQNEVRWDWQHSVTAARTLRYSITFRTMPTKMRTPKARR
jgi:alkylated DNA repair dioxygenase AlkB